ncbi:MAG: hypothetical protein ACJ72L_19705 [Marmoricola sp.]
MLILAIAVGVLVQAFAGATTLPQGVSGTLSGAGNGAMRGTLMIELLDPATDMYDGYSMSGTETPGECQYPCRFYDTEADASFNVPLAPGQYWIRSHLLRTPKVGYFLHAVAPKTSPAATVRSRWYRDGREILNATDSRYTLNAGDRGHHITVRMTLSKPAYTTVVRTIRTTSAVR